MSSDGPLDRLLRTWTPASRDTNPPPAQPSAASDSAENAPQPNVTPVQSRKRHHVSTLSERLNVTQWMTTEAAAVGPQKLISKAVRQFPRAFSGSQSAKLEKARRWWNSRDKTLQLKQRHARAGNLVAMSATGRHQMNKKAIRGRGRRQAEWVKTLHVELIQEFERLSCAGVKFSPAVLQHLAQDLICNAPIGSSFHSSVLYKGVPIDKKVTIRWIQNFMIRSNIVLRTQTGKLCTSPEKKELIEKEVAFHLGVLKRGFEDGTYHEEDMENADETHIVFNMDNGKTLGLRGTNHVKYADVVSGGENITMMVRITGGPNAMVEVPFLIFKNKSRSYPIRGVPDTVQGVCYRSQPKGWMDAAVFLQWLNEPRAMSRKVGSTRQLFVDNCGGHVVNDEVEATLRSLNTAIHKLPPNATDLVQPADSFVIQKLKELWRRHWEFYKSKCVRENNWTRTSGCIPNPGKTFYLKLCAQVVREFNELKDKKGVRYARKAMIRTGMSLDLDKTWRESQLSGELQEIIARHRSHFNGSPVHVTGADIETETDSD